MARFEVNWRADVINIPRQNAISRTTTTIASCDETRRKSSAKIVNLNLNQPGVMIIFVSLFALNLTPLLADGYNR